MDHTVGQTTGQTLGQTVDPTIGRQTGQGTAQTTGRPMGQAAVDLEHAARATRELAAFVAGLRYEDLPEAVRERARWVFADTVGVALRGSIEPEMQALYPRLPAGGGARLLKEGFPATDPASAAWANAAAISFLELDEGSRPTGHPALHVLPVTLAFAQAQRASGRELLTALVAGYEVQARLQWATRLRWAVHPHGNFGHPAAVAAVGKLAGWDTEQLVHGITAAASLATATSWRPCLVGATVRNAYAGTTAQVAMSVRLLVEAGFTGDPAALAETFGNILGEGFDPAALTDRLGQRFGIMENYFKFHAACALTHPVLDALAQALGATRQEGVYPPWSTPPRPAPAEVVRVRVRVLERFARLAGPAQPNQLSAKFSIPYAVAAYLVTGQSAPASFTTAQAQDPVVRALQDRVEVTGDPALTTRWPKEAPAEVTIELRDGRVLHGRCDNPFGSYAVPPGVDSLRAKFLALVGAVLPSQAAEKLWQQALAVDQLEDMARFPAV